MNDFEINAISVNILKKFRRKKRNNFFNHTVALLVGHIFESEQMNVLISNVISFRETQEDLTDKTQAHDSTPEIIEKINECSGYLNRMKKTIDSLRNVPDSESKEMYKTLSLWLRKARPIYIATTTRGDQEEVMRALIPAYEENEKIAEYLEELNVDNAFKEAITLHNQLITLTNQRSGDKGHYKNVRKIDRTKAIFHLQLLVNEIVKMAHQKGSQQELYQFLSRNIETNLIEARTIYEARMTRIANGQEVEEDEFDNDHESTEDDMDVHSEGSNGTTSEPEGSTSDTTNDNNDSAPIE